MKSKSRMISDPSTFFMYTLIPPSFDAWWQKIKFITMLCNVLEIVSKILNTYKPGLEEDSRKNWKKSLLERKRFCCKDAKTVSYEQWDHFGPRKGQDSLQEYLLIKLGLGIYYMMSKLGWVSARTSEKGKDISTQMTGCLNSHHIYEM